MSTILVIEDSEGQRAEVRADLQLKRVRAQRDLLEQNEELKRLARTDALTGLANRRKLDERLLAEFRRSARFGTPFAIAMADIDRFKSVNDEYGHLVGGVIISGGAGRGGAMKEIVCETDCAGRYGGEEFLAILGNNGEYGGRAFAERWRSASRESRFEWIPGKPSRHRSASACGSRPLSRQIIRAQSSLCPSCRGG